MRRRSLRSFTVGLLAMLFAVSFGVWIARQPQRDGTPGPLRAILDFNARIWHALQSEDRHPPVRGAPAGAKPRFNGDIGLDDEVDLEDWSLNVYVEDRLVRKLDFNAIKWLPRTDTATQFYCIEGWSTDFTYAGVKFSDFMKAYGLSDQYRYVGLETPDGRYYVSIDMDSMLNRQTLLAYEMNQRPLSQEDGFPLRLIIPIKYGIKSLKRIGTLRLTNTRPRDYWAERGYDWYAGL